MIKLNELRTIHLKFTQDSLSNYESWENSIFNFLFNYSRTMQLNMCITSKGKVESSIVKDIGDLLSEGRIQDRYYAVSSISGVSLKEFKDIIESDEFYLGHIFLISGAINEAVISTLIVSKREELHLSGYEIFRMDTDGYYFYCHNPINYEETLKLIRLNFSIN